MLVGNMNRFVASLVAGLICGTAHAVEPFGATPEEMKLCSALVFGGKDQSSMIRIEPGTGWQSTHHWCDCVRFRFRAIRKAGDKGAYGHNLNEAVDGCSYVIQAVGPAFRALPRVYVDRGRAYSLRGDRALAIQDFLKAIELDPAEVSAYVDLSELQRTGGNRIPALETITLGLRHNPDSKSLQKRYLELGGKEPFPAPIARVESAPEQKPLPPKVPESHAVSPADPVDPVEQVVVPVEAGSKDDGTAATGEPATEAADGNAGRSCRFCPPEEIQRRWVESFRSRQEKRPE